MWTQDEGAGLGPREQLERLSLGRQVPQNMTQTHHFHGSDKTDKCLDCAQHFKRLEPRSFFEALSAGLCSVGYLLREEPFHHGWYHKLVHGCPRLYLIKLCHYL